MRRQGTFLAALFVAFVVLSLLADRGAAERRDIIGTIIERRVDEMNSVANEQTAPGGVRLVGTRDGLRGRCWWHEARRSRDCVVQERGRAPFCGG